MTAAAAVVRIVEDRLDEAGGVVAAELVRALALRPAEVPRRRRRERGPVDLLALVLADVADPESPVPRSNENRHGLRRP